MTLWDWNLCIPEFQTLQDVKYLVLNSLEGVIPNASSTVREQGCGALHLSFLALWGLLLPRDTPPSTPGHRDSGAAANEGSFIVRVTENSRAVSNLVKPDPSQLTVQGWAGCHSPHFP